MRKKSYLILLCALLVFSLCPVGASAVAADNTVYTVDWAQFNIGDKIDNSIVNNLSRSGGADIKVVNKGDSKPSRLATVMTTGMCWT
jgi:ABC-type glycerol-3-phosphate transport system substrate-binding protein